ncbi:transglutaminase-like domain-containing protein [Ancylobacter amanitiformis]|uniref:Transglutaminase-like putative cysteine protease n=1 Tax=Ancylobacter amanitiformis TaxID=217069 RepID=A0ABU0LN95_9HYPH|nr:transglutaminase family protein [Ancylobacter amanitiformis]MDQ0510177.1 transglutaminase-like putative cysteine protease [Ancylobacter amanitiformis]
MKFSVAARLAYEVRETTVFILNIEAAALRNQKILSETLDLTPAVAVDRHELEGGTRLVRVVVEPGTFEVAYDAEVELAMHDADPSSVGETPVAQLPLDVVPFLNPSRYCQSDRLARFAYREFGALPPGHARVTAICNWIHDHVDYLSGSSTSETSAYDTMVQRAGVCRDFAHLGIAFCRALAIPSRFASAYAWQLDPPDFHAVFECYLDGAWYLFDPTRKAALQGLVRIGVGRDAADAAFATIYGNAEMNSMAVTIAPLDEVAEEEPTVRAVGIA